VAALPLDLLRLAALLAAGAIASAINAVAGGGTLVSFPILIALGMPEVTANATNSAALWTGSLGSALGFRGRSAPVGDPARPAPRSLRRALLLLLVPTVLGSVVGAALLSLSSERAFRLAVPGLVLLSTLLLALQPRIKRWALAGQRRLPTWAGLVLQFLICVYGGYFGAGMGILMLALLGLYVEGDLHTHNALKAWLGVAVNLLAALLFLWQGLIDLPAAAALVVGAVIGGYAAARLSLRVQAEALRRGVVVLGAVLALWFTFRALRG
jgi:uncharacterized membrane protein YfcA